MERRRWRLAAWTELLFRDFSIYRRAAFGLRNWTASENGFCFMRSDIPIAYSENYLTYTPQKRCARMIYNDKIDSICEQRDAFMNKAIKLITEYSDEESLFPIHVALHSYASCITLEEEYRVLQRRSLDALSAMCRTPYWIYYRKITRDSWSNERNTTNIHTGIALTGFDAWK